MTKVPWLFAAIAVAATGLAGCQGTYSSTYRPAANLPSGWSAGPSPSNPRVLFTGDLATDEAGWEARGFTVIGTSSFFKSDQMISMDEEGTQAAAQARAVGAELVLVQLHDYGPLGGDYGNIGHHGVDTSVPPIAKTKVSAVFLRRLRSVTATTGAGS